MIGDIRGVFQVSLALVQPHFPGLVGVIDRYSSETQQTQDERQPELLGIRQFRQFANLRLKTADSKSAYRADGSRRFTGAIVTMGSTGNVEVTNGGLATKLKCEAFFWRVFYELQ